MEIIALLGVAVLIGLAVFQILLIIGFPLGEYAWGGQHRVLPRNLRISSVFSLFLYALFAVFLVSKAEILSLVLNGTVLITGMWIFTGYFILGIFMNLISRSKKERALMTPVAFMLAVVFLIVTLST